MTTTAISARPPTAAICWTANGRLFIEYPVKDGPPYIIAMACTMENIAKALNIMIEHPAPTLTPKAEVIADHPKIKRIKVEVSEEARNAAAAIVRRMLK